ncbi:MAG: DNA-3-methyladenine glycosylase [Saprospiraceae bacterium]|nr:DNA-3-methyladenine glycosylase [Saprospiraceae bacterium]
MLLPRKYYLSDDVLGLTRDILGKMLVSQIQGIRYSGIIVEAEAYRAPEDRASHAFGNRLTPRTKTMFLDGGHAYIYVCYGIHEMFNIITGPIGTPHAILIRAVEPREGIAQMQKNRGISEAPSALTKGPGCLTQAMGINRALNACKLYEPESPLQIHDIQITYNKAQIGQSKRIGVESAGESAQWLYRFYLKGNDYVSGSPR